MKDGGNLDDEEEEATGGCTLTRVIFPDLATTVVRRARARILLVGPIQLDAALCQC